MSEAHEMKSSAEESTSGDEQVETKSVKKKSNILNPDDYRNF